jgi:hypothetical protein
MTSLQSASLDELRQMLAERGVDAPPHCTQAQLLERVQVHRTLQQQIKRAS